MHKLSAGQQREPGKLLIRGETWKMQILGELCRSGENWERARPSHRTHPVPSGQRTGPGPAAVTFHMLRDAGGNGNNCGLKGAQKPRSWSFVGGRRAAAAHRSQCKAWGDVGGRCLRVPGRVRGGERACVRGCASMHWCERCTALRVHRRENGQPVHAWGFGTSSCVRVHSWFTLVSVHARML